MQYLVYNAKRRRSNSKAILSVKDFVEEITLLFGKRDEMIVKNLNASFIFNEWRGFGPQKDLAKSKVKWVLNIDVSII